VFKRSHPLKFIRRQSGEEERLVTLAGEGHTTLFASRCPLGTPSSHYHGQRESLDRNASGDWSHTGRPALRSTNIQQSGLIILVGGSVFKTETSSARTETTDLISTACCDDLGYWSKGFDSNFLSFLKFFPFVASFLQRPFHSFWTPFIYNVPYSFLLPLFHLRMPIVYKF
jgi:hypothetical protein